MQDDSRYQSLIRKVCADAGIEDMDGVLKDGMVTINGSDVELEHDTALFCVTLRAVVGTVPSMYSEDILKAMLEHNAQSSGCEFGLLDGYVAIVKRAIAMAELEENPVPSEFLMDLVEDMQTQWDDLNDRVLADLLSKE